MRRRLEINDLTVSIGGTAVCAGLNLTLTDGQAWALVGRNGVGKTTLLFHLAGLLGGHGGAIRLHGNELAHWEPRQRAREIGLLLQDSATGFGEAVVDNVLSGRHPHLGMLDWESDTDRAIANEAIEALGLSALADRAVDTLSGGERRRVDIARLLTQQTWLSLLDEPTNHLDPAHQALILDLVQTRCADAGHSFVLVTHDLNLAFHAASHWLVLFGDGSWATGTREAMSHPDVLERAFACRMRRLGEGQDTWIGTALR